MTIYLSTQLTAQENRERINTHFDAAIADDLLDLRSGHITETDTARLRKEIEAGRAWCLEELSEAVWEAALPTGPHDPRHVDHVQSEASRSIYASISREPLFPA